MARDDEKGLAVIGIERITLNERVYQRLRSSLAGGKLMPSSRLDEETLGRELGVSRTPIREAIGKLTKEGFVEYRPYQGNFVRSFSAAQVDDLYTVRQALESLAVRLAVPRLSDADIRRLIAILQEAETALERGDNFGLWGGRPPVPPGDCRVQRERDADRKSGPPERAGANHRHRGQSRPWCRRAHSQ